MFLVGYYVRSGQWHPRVVYDPSGRRVSLAELSPLPHAFGGVTLGMTSAELMRAKGKPVREEPSHWLYDSIDSKHDGLLDVYFQERAEGKPAAVWAVLFWGKREAEPAGISDLLAFTRQDLVMRYGSPVSENKLGLGSGYLYFRNGLMVYTDDDKVTRYGMYTRVQ